MKFGPGHFTFNWRLTLTLTLGRKVLQRRSWKGFDFRLRKKEKSWDKILRRWGKQARFRYTGSLSWCGTPSYTTLVGWGQEPVRKLDESESGQIVLEKVKRAYSGADLCQTMWSHAKQARKPRSYDSPKLWPSDLLTGVKCRATSVAKNQWKGSNGQLHCFYNRTSVTSGALSWKRLFTQGKLKRPFLNF